MANVYGLDGRSTAVAAVVLLVGATLAVALAAPASADLSTSGVWIFPHERQTAVLGGTLGQYYYNTTSGDDWIDDAFFADADTDGATVKADFYNPTGGDLGNVILWVAVSDDSLFTSINFSGGSSGDMGVGVDDLGGGTPTTGASLPDFVYPAFYTSYGVGDIDADGVTTVTLDITGDFASGLVLRLDYTATDANDDDVSGPFDAGMSVYEWGDLPADDEGGDDCQGSSGLELRGSLTQGEKADGGLSINATIELVADFGYQASDVNVTLTPGPGLTLMGVQGGTIWNNVGSVAVDGFGGNIGNVTLTNITAQTHSSILPGDEFSLDINATIDICGETEHLADRPSIVVSLTPSGSTDTASSWARDLAAAIRGSNHGRHAPDFNLTQYSTFMGAIALHSTVFTYGPWDGTDPMGGDDQGWIDISNLSNVLSILRKDGSGNGNMKELEQEMLALWLNVASGKVNLGSELSTSHRGNHWGDDGDCHGHSRARLPGIPDDVQGVLTGAETNLTDYVDSLTSSSSSSHGNGHGHGHDDDDDHGSQQSARSLWGSAVLCWLVNSGWLRVG